MRAAWREQGHRVEVVPGPRRVDADVVLLHVDRTVVPDAYLHAIAAHPRVLNRRVVDISKTLVSLNRVRTPEEWAGPVVVKTVRNAGGLPEAGGRWQRRWHEAAAAVLGLGRARVIAGRYPVYDSAASVPARVYSNPALFVERFLPEPDGALYCVRSYTFFGDRFENVRYVGPFPIVKRRDVLSAEPAPVPPRILELRARLGFDYGKFDYVLRGGEVVVFDVNRTPAFGGRPDEQERQGRLLADGLAAVVEGASPA